MNSRKNRSSFFVIITFLFSIQAACAAADRIYTSNSAVKLVCYKEDRVSCITEEWNDIELPSKEDALSIQKILRKVLCHYLQDSLFDSKFFKDMQSDLNNIDKAFNVFYTNLFKHKELEKQKRSIKTVQAKKKAEQEILRSYAYIVKCLNCMFQVDKTIYTDCKTYEVFIQNFSLDTVQAQRIFSLFNKAIYKFLLDEDLIEKKTSAIKMVQFQDDEDVLGFFVDKEEVYPFVVSKKSRISTNHMSRNLYMLAIDGSPIESSGFFITQMAGENLICTSSGYFNIRFIQGLNGEHPFQYQDAMNIYIENASFLSAIETGIYDKGVKRGVSVFFPLPTTGQETRLALIELIELIEERVQNKECPLSTKALTYLHQNIQKTVNMIMAEGQDFEALSYVEVEMEDTENPALHKRVLEQLSQTKKIYTEKILSEYEEQIIKEQETRKVAVIAGSVTGRSKGNKSKGKKGKKQQRLAPQRTVKDTEKSVDADRKQVRIEALDRFQEQSQKAKVKLRHMTKVINAISKKYKMDGVNVRVKGSHCNFDAGEGQTQSFVLPHGKKDGVSFGVANKFFNALAQTMAVLDLKD